MAPSHEPGIGTSGQETARRAGDVPDATALPAWRLFTGLFADAQAEGLPLVPLRVRPRDPQTAFGKGDYDLLMPPHGFAHLVRLLGRGASLHRASFSINLVKPQKIQVLMHAPEIGRSIMLEVWTRLQVSDPARRSARAIPWSALETLVRNGPDGPRLPADIEIAYYVSHLATGHKRLDQPEVVRRLASYCALSERDAPEVLHLVADLRQPALHRAATTANAYLRSRGVLAACGPIKRLQDGCRATIESFARRKRRRAIATCRVTAVTGADGVGKSTVIERLCTTPRRFKGLYRHHPFYKLVKILRPGADVGAGGQPLPKNQLDELAVGAMFHLARWSWPWFRMGARVSGRRCLDRGFPDLLFDGLRGTSPSPQLRQGWQALAQRMPQPDWHIHLDAPDAVILGRKRELSEAALRCYRDGMLAIIAVAPAPAFSRIDTSGSREATDACLRLAANDLGIRFRWREQR
jgi:hypothetical protein